MNEHLTTLREMLTQMKRGRFSTEVERDALDAAIKALECKCGAYKGIVRIANCRCQEEKQK